MEAEAPEDVVTEPPLQWASLSGGDDSSQAVIKPSALTRWKNMEVPPVQDSDVLTDDKENEEKNAQPPRFPIDDGLNNKLALWRGELTELMVDAVVNTTNERLNERNGVSANIFARAGPELAAECMRLEGCHTGEAVITKGYELPASYVIHTVGPRFSVKYQTAAENALHGCYRRCLELAVENGLASIAFPVVNTDRKGYPKEPAAHIALRTIRRFLEKFGRGLECVVLCMAVDDDFALYQRLIPLYFPRDSRDERRAARLLPQDVGNELGEVVIKDREIRISVMPGMASPNDVPVTVTPTDRSLVSGRIGQLPAAQYNQPEFTAPAEKGADDTFAAMQDNPDDIRKKSDAGKSRAQLEQEEIDRRYAAYLRKAREEKLEDMAEANFLFPSGTDTLGRPVIVLVANRIPASTPEQLERVLLYSIRILDPIVVNDYTLIYFHTNIEAKNKPPFNWMRHVYQIFNRKYKKNMKRMFIVHPTFWVKVALVFMTPFVKEKFWKKLKKVEKILDLYEEVDQQQLQIPADILKYDQNINQAAYADKFGAKPQPKADPEAEKGVLAPDGL